MQGLREEIVALQRRIKELEAQHRALASVLVQHLQQGSPGEAVSKVPAGGAGDEPLVGHSAVSVSVCAATHQSHAETEHTTTHIFKFENPRIWYI